MVEMSSPAYGVANLEELASPLHFWDFVKFAFKGSHLAHLALVILSIVTNTATCEQLFSKLAQIHIASDQDNVVDVRMEEECIEQKEDDQEQDDEEEKEKEPVEPIDHVLFEWSNILGLGMGEVDANDDEGLEVVEEGQGTIAMELEDWRWQKRS
ncbi:unnamed protein product [Sphagnum tenellum]